RSSTSCAAAARASEVNAYTRTLLSTNASRRASSGICLVPIEFPIWRKLLAEGANPRQCPLPRPIPRDVEGALADDVHLDLVPLLQPKGLDHGRWQPKRQTVSPLRYLHGSSPDIRA